MLAIFDIYSVNITGYNIELLEKNLGKYIAYVDDRELYTELDSSMATQICISGWSIKRIIRSFKNHNVTEVIISGQRPPDFRVMVAANSLNIPIIYKMHGLYVEHVKRNLSFYLSNISKVLKTTFYLFDIALFTKNIRIPIGIFLSFVFGLSRKYWLTSEVLRIDHGLIWSEYWKLWHERVWAMNPRQGWNITGNPDTIKFKNIQVDDQSICYIYQTLAEDGRASHSYMEFFYDELKKIASNEGKVINVKWHARGDVAIREGLEHRGFKVYDDFPVADVYVGHFSSLLGLIPIIGGIFIVFELEGHPTPKPIMECATLVTCDIDVLAKALVSTYEEDEVKKANAIYYFGSNYSHDVESSIVTKYLN